MAGKKWKKVKEAFSLIKLKTRSDDGDSVSTNPTVIPYDSGHGGASDDAGGPSSSAVPRPQSPPSPPTSSVGLFGCFVSSPKFASSSTSSSKAQTCEICSYRMIPGQGYAIFNAECSHSFHFSCITTNLIHGNQICPICRRKWQEIPFQCRTPGPREKLRQSSVSLSSNDPQIASSQQQPVPRPSGFIAEPDVYNDDEVIEQQSEVGEPVLISRIEMTTLPEVPAVSKSTTFDDFAVLIHLKSRSFDPRTPIDLVALLDVSGSMSGTKLEFIKRDMDLVIKHMGPNDRLSVIAFSSTARRLFPLRRMTDTMKSEALQTINSLTAFGATNIAEGLRMGAKVMIDRRFKNPVASIILLSDGRDTYTVDHSSLFPSPVQQIPVHTFGYGDDHEASLMHYISEKYGGKFTYVIEIVDFATLDSFAQSMGDLLRVITLDLKVFVESSLPMRSIEAGKYEVHLSNDAMKGVVVTGELYAEQERDILVTMNIPVDSADEMLLLKVNCIHREPLTNMPINLGERRVKIERPDAMVSTSLGVAIEVDRHRNRVRAAKAMSEAKSAAESGDHAGAVSILKNCRETISASQSAQADDAFAAGLCVELGKMEARMSSRQVYEASGRAYVLSGLSRLSWQWATTNDEATSSSADPQVDQTSMTDDTTTTSQTIVLGNVLPR